MKSYEERKKEYLEKTQSNDDLATKIFDYYSKDEKGKERIALIFTPRNERELDIAEIMYSLLDDTFTLREDVENDRIKLIPLEENEGFKVYVNVIKSLYNGDRETALKYCDIISDRKNPKILYEVGASGANDSSDIFDYICNELEIDKDNVASMIRLFIYINESTKIMEEKTKNINDKKPEDYTEEEVQQYREYADEFHKLCVEGKKEKEETVEDERVQRLVRIITDTLTSLLDNDNPVQ